mmetsp:Transcript_74017/g.176183  ORF Transcript_74017/g.176183 Transcript_74017/m.176183 type:complete len:263 (+) Transcript_74017:263-1051(+)
MHRLIATAARSHLMAPDDHVQAVPVQKPRCDILPKRFDEVSISIARGAVDTKPIAAILCERIRPQHVVQDFVGLQSSSAQRTRGVPHICHAPVPITNATVHNQNPFRQHAAEGQDLEASVHVIKHGLALWTSQARGTVLMETLCLHVLVEVPLLVVASQQHHLIGISQLQSHYQCGDLQLVCSSIHPVTIENVGRPVAGWEAKVVEKQQHVAEVTMEVAKDLGWCARLADRWLCCVQSSYAICNVLHLLGHPRRILLTKKGL